MAARSVHLLEGVLRQVLLLRLSAASSRVLLTMNVALAGADCAGDCRARTSTILSARALTSMTRFIHLPFSAFRWRSEPGPGLRPGPVRLRCRRRGGSDRAALRAASPARTGASWRRAVLSGT